MDKLRIYDLEPPETTANAFSPGLVLPSHMHTSKRELPLPKPAQWKTCSCKNVRAPSVPPDIPLHSRGLVLTTYQISRVFFFFPHFGSVYLTPDLPLMLTSIIHFINL